MCVALDAKCAGSCAKYPKLCQVNTLNPCSVSEVVNCVPAVTINFNLADELYQATHVKTNKIKTFCDAIHTHRQNLICHINRSYEIQ